MKSRRSDPTCAKESVLFQILFILNSSECEPNGTDEKPRRTRRARSCSDSLIFSYACPSESVLSASSVFCLDHTLFISEKRTKVNAAGCFYLIFLLTKKEMTTTYGIRCPFGLNRESRVNRERSRRCDRGQASQNATSPQDRWGKARRANDPGVRIPALRVRHFSAVNTEKVLSSGR